MKKIIFGALFASMGAFALPTSTSCKISRYGDLTGVTSRQVLEGENMNRSCMLVINKGAASVYVQVSSSLQSGSNGVIIPSGGNWEPQVTPVNVIYVAPLAGTTASVYYHFGAQ